MTSLIKQWNEAIANNYGAPPLGLVSGAGSTVVDEEGSPTLTCWPALRSIH